MKRIIVLYGTPGVGKLTVARELSEKTNSKVFHNHLLSDFLSELFDTGTEEFTESFRYLWFYLFEKLLKNDNEGVILTLVYGVQTLEGKDDNDFFFEIKRIAEENKREVFFIKLECSDEELKKRVESEDRKRHKKLTDVSVIEGIRKKYDVDMKVPSVESVVMDTTNLSAKQTAERIVKEIRVA